MPTGRWATACRLNLLHDLVAKACAEKEIEPRHYRFTQREARTFTGWTPPQVKRHLAKLCELEYVLTHRGGRGQSWVYELVYNGEGRDGANFLMGLIDVEKLRAAAAYDDHRDGQKAGWDGRGTPTAPLRDGSGSPPQNGSNPSSHASSEAAPPSRDEERTTEDNADAEEGQS